MNKIGAKLKKLRSGEGLTLVQVGNSVGMSKSRLWEVENGKTKNPSFDSVTKLAIFYGVKIDYLGGTDDIEFSPSKYYELLNEVAGKIPGETRHETAKRIIKESSTSACETVGQDG